MLLLLQPLLIIVRVAVPQGGTLGSHLGDVDVDGGQGGAALGDDAVSHGDMGVVIELLDFLDLDVPLHPATRFSPHHAETGLTLAELPLRCLGPEARLRHGEAGGVAGQVEVCIIVAQRAEVGAVRRPTNLSAIHKGAQTVD